MVETGLGIRHLKMTKANLAAGLMVVKAKSLDRRPIAENRAALLLRGSALLALLLRGRGLRATLLRLGGLGGRHLTAPVVVWRSAILLNCSALAAVLRPDQGRIAAIYMPTTTPAIEFAFPSRHLVSLCCDYVCRKADLIEGGEY
jgi:hypothetical protein